MNNIKKARILRGLSQKYVAAALGVAAPSVSDWERGKTCPTAANLQALSELLDVSTDYLLGTEDGGNDRSIKKAPAEENAADAQEVKVQLTQLFENLSKLSPEQLDRYMQILKLIQQDKDR